MNFPTIDSNAPLLGMLGRADGLLELIAYCQRPDGSWTASAIQTDTFPISERLRECLRLSAECKGAAGPIYVTLSGQQVAVIEEGR
jgi:hypothetical protein